MFPSRTNRSRSHHPADQRRSERRHHHPDLSKLLGWKAQTPFEVGLERTVEWYRANADWWRPQMWLRHIPIVTATGKREVH